MQPVHAFPITAVWPGAPYPLGATWDGEGVNFALFSEHAEKVELCLFDPSGRHEVQRIVLCEQTDLIWHCYLPEARPGLLYGYRVHGPYDPQRGHRFNPNKLLIDPYARELVGPLDWSDAHYGHRPGDPDGDLSFDTRDNAQGMPKCRIADPAFSWGDDRPPRVPWHEMTIYELHVRGFTIEHPDVPPALRGTYAGLATAPAIEHFKRLGVTSIELMPTHSFVDDRHLVDQGLRNYWGYNSIGYFAPEQRYSASGSAQEFKTMVKTLHSAGLEIILDVVYNHTAEGNHLGPTLSFKGIDNSVYYRLQADNPRFYRDYTGCGNTLDLQHPRVLQLVMDSLRYWVQEMHVDGFRFDLAAALGREQHAVDHLGAFFDILHQDPVLSRVKLIAEPWDLGEDGYQVGKFPLGWAEWNDRYRDCMRAFWRGDGGLIGEFATRITGSSDLYAHNGRRPYASVNFIAAHDGFTLEDLVSYQRKHNQANGEDNRDGSDRNLSWNCGVEGPSDDPDIRALRDRQKRNLLATLMFSQGVPMLLAGDELGRSQRGNNNAYCQDNPIGWIDWSLLGKHRALHDFVARIVHLRRTHPVFRRRNFFQGRPIRHTGGAGIKDIHWLKPDGSDMSDAEWSHDFARSLGVYLSGEALGTVDRQGRAIRDDNFILLFNAHHERIDFALPKLCAGCAWQVDLDTHYHDGLDPDGRYVGGHRYPLEGRTLALLRQVRADAPAP